MMPSCHDAKKARLRGFSLIKISLAKMQTRGEGVKNPKNIVDVIEAWPQALNLMPHLVLEIDLVADAARPAADAAAFAATRLLDDIVAVY